MKHLSIEKNRQLLKLEFEDEPCGVFLTKRTRAVRFDILLAEDDKLSQIWRAQVTMDDSERPILELKDYRDNGRHYHRLQEGHGIAEISNIALNLAWNLLENGERNIPVISVEESFQMGETEQDNVVVLEEPSLLSKPENVSILLVVDDPLLLPSEEDRIA